MSRLAGKVIVVTGAASGIGYACAELFVSAGARVLLGDIDEVGGRALADALGDAALFVPLDAGSEPDWEGAMQVALDQWQRVDGVANIAGIGTQDDDIEHNTEESWRAVMRVNHDGVFLGTKHGVRAMKDSGGGSIVNISSIYAIVSNRFGRAMAYTASKGGVRILSKAAAMHCARERYQIRVNTIHPGYIETPMLQRLLDAAADATVELADLTARHPIGRLGNPRDIANAALYLLSDESAFVTGAELAIDGGYTAV